MNAYHAGSDTSRREFVRRGLTAGALALPGMSALGSCATAGGGAGSNAKGKVSADNPLGVDPAANLEVVIFKGGYGAEWAKYDEKIYRKRYPEAKVKHSGIQQIQQQLQPRFVAGKPPDVVDNAGEHKMDLGTLVGQGQVADLSDLLKAPSLDGGEKVADTLLPGTVDYGTYNDTFRVLNYVYTVFGVWHSQSLLDKKGWKYPKTWQEMLDLGEEARKDGMALFTYGGQNAVAYVQRMTLAMAAKKGGSKVLRNIDNLEPKAWHDPAMQAAVEAIHELVERDYFLDGSSGLMHTQAQTSWVNGKCVFYPSGSWIGKEMQGITPDDFEMVMSPTPSLSGSDQLPFTTIYAAPDESFIVPAQADNVRGGMEFLRIMLSKKSAAHFSELTHSPTVVRGAVPNGTDFGSSVFRSVNEALDAAGDNIVSSRYGAWYAQLGRATDTAMGNLLAGRSDPEAYIRACQQAADKVAQDSSIKKYRR